MTKSLLLVASLSLFVFASCKKEAGFGGLSVVSGKVYAKDFKPNTTEIEAEGYTANMKVVIAVEGNGEVLDEVRTDNNGAYKFDKLRKGDYLIWTFTDCDKCTNNDSLVIQKVTIDERKGDYELEDFNIEI